jgi:hypothetical protein
VIRTGHPDDPPLTAVEAARIARITAAAALRGQYTDAQKKTIDRILDGARKRAEKAAAAART